MVRRFGRLDLALAMNLLRLLSEERAPLAIADLRKRYVERCGKMLSYYLFRDIINFLADAGLVEVLPRARGSKVIISGRGREALSLYEMLEKILSASFNCND